MKVIVFDRDGTLMKHVEYPKYPCQVELLPGAKRLWDLKEHYSLFLHTNQSGVFRKKISEDQLKDVQNEFFRQLGGNPFSHVWVSKEAPGDEGPGSTRKPSPQVINTISISLQIQKENITMIGDSECDAMAAQNAGVKFIPAGDLNEIIDQLLQ